MTTVEFPGLGIGPFTMDRVAFEFFGKPVYWYGVLIMLGMVAAFLHAYWRTKHEGIKVDDLLDVGIWTVVVGVIGARLYYVLTSLDGGGYTSFMDVIAIWEGGLAIYGGVIGGALAIVVVCLVKKINTLKVMDAVAPGVMLAQAIGRWGNFVNGEAFGEPVPADHFLYRFRMGLESNYTEGAGMQYYHPTFLYESVWNIVGFILITCLYRKKKFNGQITLMYLTWYGFGRMFIEGLRTDSLWVGSFRISQVVGAVCFIAGAALLVTGFILSHKGKLDKWLKVVWAQPAPAGVSNPAKTNEIETAATDEPTESDTPAADTPAAGSPDTPPVESPSPAESGSPSPEGTDDVAGTDKDTP